MTQQELSNFAFAAESVGEAADASGQMGGMICAGTLVLGPAEGNDVDERVNNVIVQRGSYAAKLRLLLLIIRAMVKERGTVNRVLRDLRRAWRLHGDDIEAAFDPDKVIYKLEDI